MDIKFYTSDKSRWFRPSFLIKKVSTISEVLISAIIDLILPAAAASFGGLCGAYYACSEIEFSDDKETGLEFEFAGLEDKGNSSDFFSSD